MAFPQAWVEGDECIVFPLTQSLLIVSSFHKTLPILRILGISHDDYDRSWTYKHKSRQKQLSQSPSLHNINFLRI